MSSGSVKGLWKWNDPYASTMGRTTRDGECLVFTSADPSRKKYGRVRTRRFGSLATHRVVWEHHNGPIPEGMIVLHMCDNPPCVEITHLSLGTPKDNSLDMISKGRGRAQFSGGPDPRRHGKRAGTV